VKTQTDEFV